MTTKPSEAIPSDAETQLQRLQGVVDQMETQKTSDQMPPPIEESSNNLMEVSEIEGCFFLGQDTDPVPESDEVKVSDVVSVGQTPLSPVTYLQGVTSADDQLLLYSECGSFEDNSWLFVMEDDATQDTAVNEREIVNWLRTSFTDSEILPVKHQLVLKLTEIEISRRRSLGNLDDIFTLNDMTDVSRDPISEPRHMPLPQPVIRPPMTLGLPGLRRPTATQRRQLPKTPVEQQQDSLTAVTHSAAPNKRVLPPEYNFGSGYNSSSTNSSDRELNRTYSKEELSKMLEQASKAEQSTPDTPTNDSNPQPKSGIPSPTTPRKGPLKTSTPSSAANVLPPTSKVTSPKLTNHRAERSPLPSRRLVNCATRASSIPSKHSPPQQLNKPVAVADNGGALRSRFGFSMARLSSAQKPATTASTTGATTAASRKLSVPAFTRPAAARSPNDHRPATAIGRGIPRLRPPRSPSVGSLTSHSRGGVGHPPSSSPSSNAGHGRTLRVPSSPLGRRKTQPVLQVKASAEMVA